MTHAFCADFGMDKPLPIEELKEKYIQLSRQYLEQLNQGKSAEELKDLLREIRSLAGQIKELENSG